MKTNPLKQGYSLATIKANIGEQVRAGKSQKAAVGIAYKTAREVFKQRHPRKALPLRLRRANPADYQSALVKKGRRRSTAPRKTQSRPTRSNPIKWVLQAVNTQSNKQGWYTGTAIDSDAQKAKHYRSVKAASAQAVKVARNIPKSWVLVVAHAHTPNP